MAKPVPKQADPVGDGVMLDDNVVAGTRKSQATLPYLL
jgi:hypothetical protein